MGTTTPNGGSTVAPVFRRFSPSPNREADAGLREVQHYQRRLPPWRYRLRERLLPLIRAETPYLARIQASCRSPMLDSYFAVTANLGTHTFFMTFLPICFWCGFADAGIALVHMLGFGVYFSGVIKDLVCLPRPLSPPLQRITMSDSAALEYGFPSTHTTNAVSAAIYGFHLLYVSRDSWSPTTYTLLCTACVCYAVSISIGRVYCGMHGFLDIIIGAVLGIIIAWIRITVGPMFDVWVISADWHRPVFVVVLLSLGVRFHPEPADNCPCFDDSVAFLGVIMGLELGTWSRFIDLQAGRPLQTLSLAPLYPYNNKDLAKSAARLVGGIIIVFVWRAVMKPTLLSVLPPIFRSIDRIGLRIPRRYFLQATDYAKVPPLGRDDNVLPSATRIPAFISSIRHPKRRRISVGPQSEADARELMAQRRELRRNTRASSNPRPYVNEGIDAPPNSTSTRRLVAETSVLRSASSPPSRLSPPGSSATAVDDDEDDARKDAEAERKDEKEMLATMQKPRPHYDAEVITKLVVYAGIAWWSVEGNPIWFSKVGLI